MMTFTVGHALWPDGDGHRHAGSVAGRAGDAHLAAEEQRALVHAEQAERLLAVAGRCRRCRRRCRRTSSATRSSPTASSMSTRVAREWRATLVRISWKMRNMVVEMSMSSFDRLRRQLGAAADAGALLEFLRLPADRGDQAHVVEHLRAQAGGDLAHRLHRRVDQLAHRVGLLEERLLAQALGEPGHLHLQAGQHLAELVVDFARDVRALFLAHRDQVRGEAAQLVLRLASAARSCGAARRTPRPSTSGSPAPPASESARHCPIGPATARRLAEIKRQ